MIYMILAVCLTIATGYSFKKGWVKKNLAIAIVIVIVVFFGYMTWYGWWPTTASSEPQAWTEVKGYSLSSTEGERLLTEVFESEKSDYPALKSRIDHLEVADTCPQPHCKMVLYVQREISLEQYRNYLAQKGVSGHTAEVLLCKVVGIKNSASARSTDSSSASDSEEEVSGAESSWILWLLMGFVWLICQLVYYLAVAFIYVVQFLIAHLWVDAILLILILVWWFRR